MAHTPQLVVVISSVLIIALAGGCGDSKPSPTSSKTNAKRKSQSEKSTEPKQSAEEIAAKHGTKVANTYDKAISQDMRTITTILGRFGRTIEKLTSNKISLKSLQSGMSAQATDVTALADGADAMDLTESHIRSAHVHYVAGLRHFANALNALAEFGSVTSEAQIKPIEARMTKELDLMSSELTRWEKQLNATEFLFPRIVTENIALNKATSELS